MPSFICPTGTDMNVAFRTNVVAGQTKGTMFTPLGANLRLFDLDIVHRAGLFTTFAGYTPPICGK